MPALNIKNEETYKLVKELADLHGKSMTAAVTDAVREKLERDRKPRTNQSRVDHWLKVGQELRAAADPDWLARDPFADLYDDELGLPK